MARGSIRWAYGTRQYKVGLWQEAVLVVELIPLWCAISIPTYVLLSPYANGKWWLVA